MRCSQILIALLLASCGGGQQLSRIDTRDWSERQADARQHDLAADAHERAAERTDMTYGSQRYNCGDPFVPYLYDQLTTGGFGVVGWLPCDDLAMDRLNEQLHAAQHERELADRARAAAAQLVRDEAVACAGIPDRVEVTPLAHREEVAQMVPVRQAGEIRGVRVVFKPVPGVTAASLRQDLVCQHARRAVVGVSPAEANDPTLVEGADTEVYDRGDHAEVVIQAATARAGKRVLALAEGAELPRPETLAGREH